VSYVTPGQAGHYFPTSSGKPASARAVIRKIVTGKLRAVRGPRGWLTTKAWVEEYLVEQTARRTGKRPAATVVQRALRARARLIAKGWVTSDAATATTR
jgi:hypothetical protein